MKSRNNRINRIFVSILSAILVIPFAALSLMPASAEAPVMQPGAKISFTFDDGFTSAYTNAAPSLAKYGFTGTSFVVTGCVGMVTVPNTCGASNDRPYMTWDQIVDLKNSYGWEIGSHTVTHPLLVSPDENTGHVLTEAERLYELTQSKADLAAHGINATSFADPFGDWSLESVAEIAKYYTVHRPFADVVDLAADTHNNVYPYNELLPYVVQVQGGVTVNKLKEYVDKAKLNNHLLVLVYHDITSGTASSSPDDYQNSATELEAIAAYAKQQGLQNTNISDAFKSGPNLLANGDFENGTTGWTTDTPSSFVLDTQTNGAYPSPTNSIKLTSTTTNAHLFFDTIPVSAVENYIIKSYLNVLSVANSSRVGFYIDEYDTQGNYLSTQAKPSENSVWVEMLNFEYVPSSAQVARARVQVVLTAGVGLTGYLDQVQFFVVPKLGVVVLGDIDGNGVIDALDLSVLLTNWAASPATKSVGDLNNDSVVDALDLSIVLSNWSI